jgi:hypothetical protein
MARKEAQSCDNGYHKNNSIRQQGPFTLKVANIMAQTSIEDGQPATCKPPPDTSTKVHKTPGSKITPRTMHYFPVGKVLAEQEPKFESCTDYRYRLWAATMSLLIFNSDSSNFADNSSEPITLAACAICLRSSSNRRKRRMSEPS